MTATTDADLFSNTEDWTPNQFLFAFFDMAQGYAFNKWADAMRHNADQSATPADLALDALVSLSTEYHRLCARSGYDPTPKAQFWSMLMTRIDWIVLRHLKLGNRTPDRWEADEVDEIERPSLEARTSLSKYHDPSLLHHDLADDVAKLTMRQQLALALWFFEELLVDDIQSILSMSRSGVRQQLSTAAELYLNIALQRIQSEPPDPIDTGSLRAENLPDTAAQWVREHYGTDIPTYLAYVRAHYRADVSYLVDFVNRAFGIRRHRVDKPRTEETIDRARQAAIKAARRLTDEQVREIRARLANGEKQVHVAHDYPVANHTISKIARRKSYGWVE